jgi:hypothetical protein
MYKEALMCFGCSPNTKHRDVNKKNCLISRIFEKSCFILTWMNNVSFTQTRALRFRWVITGALLVFVYTHTAYL